MTDQQNQFVGFIQVFDNESVPEWKLLEILLQLQNTDIRMTSIVMHKKFPCFICGGKHGYEWNHWLSEGVENCMQDSLF